MNQEEEKNGRPVAKAIDWLVRHAKVISMAEIADILDFSPSSVYRLCDYSQRLGVGQLNTIMLEVFRRVHLGRCDPAVFQKFYSMANNAEELGINCSLVARPQSTHLDVQLQLMDVTLGVGQLAGTVKKAVDPAGPGGSDIVPVERAEIDQRILDLEKEIAELRSTLDQATTTQDTQSLYAV